MGKTTLFCLASLFILGLVSFKTWPHRSSKKIRATITVNEGKIRSLTQDRTPKLQTVQHFDSLDFPPHKYLRHKSHRPVGFGSNFFIDFSAKLEVIETASYTFKILSDDGFRLKIDGLVLGEYLSDRPAKSSSFVTTLSAGTHLIEISYFQGEGPAAIVASYQREGGKLMPIGKDSVNSKFSPLN